MTMKEEKQTATDGSLVNSFKKTIQKLQTETLL
jgi:hypothetical protein